MYSIHFPSSFDEWSLHKETCGQSVSAFDESFVYESGSGDGEKESVTSMPPGNGTDVTESVPGGFETLSPNLNIRNTELETHQTESGPLDLPDLSDDIARDLG